MLAKSVLIVDDDKTFTKALATRCKGMGLDAQVSFEGLHGMMTILQQPPDLLILDVDMPGTDGMRVCEELVKDERLSPIPVIMLTGKSDDATVRRCEELGAHYVWKGLDTWDQLSPLICRLLEIQAADGNGEDAPQPTTGPSAATPAEATRPKVMVIDDDPAISKALKVRLRGYGVEVLRAFNGMQGYWMVLKHEPDVIITDINMPEASGNHLLGRLQGHSVTKHIPVIVLTGRTINGNKDFALERQMLGLGAKAFLTKPLDFPALLVELRRYIDLAKTPFPITR